MSCFLGYIVTISIYYSYFFNCESFKNTQYIYMTSIDELVRLIEDETLLYRDIKTQYRDYDIKRIGLWSMNEEFLYGILYDLFDGHVFGIDTVVEVLLLAEEDQVANLEVIYCNFVIGGLPKFKDLKITSCLDDIKKCDYLILHHEVDWGPQDKEKTRMDIINEQYTCLRLFGKKINECLPTKSKVILVGDCLSLVRLIIGLYTPDFPPENIHGVTRHYERAAVCLLANKLKVPMREIKGVGVFGEDIVETTNCWIHVSNEDHEDEVYEESVQYYQPEIYEMMKINQKRPGNLLEDLERPIEVPKVYENSCSDETTTKTKNHGLIFTKSQNEECISDDGQNSLLKSEISEKENARLSYSEKEEKIMLELERNETVDEKLKPDNGFDIEKQKDSITSANKYNECGTKNSKNEDTYRTRHERDVFPPFGIPELPEDGPGFYLKSWTKLALERLWLTGWVQGLHDVPEEWKTENNMSRLLNRKPPVKSLRWVVGRLDNEKFHSYTLPKKCRSEQNGYSLARGVSDYIIFLLKKSCIPKRTNSLVCSSGIYGVPSGLFFSFPVVVEDNLTFRIIQGFHVSETTYMRINDLVKVLEKEYDYIMELFNDFPQYIEGEIKSSTVASEHQEEDLLVEEEGSNVSTVHEEIIESP